MHIYRIAIRLAIVLGLCSFSADSLSAGLIQTFTPPVALAGLLTGFLGTALGGISVKLLLRDMKQKEEEEAGEIASSYLHYRRYKRNSNVVQKINEDQIDQIINMNYEKDASQCLEKMICTVAAKSSNREDMDAIERNLLDMSRSEVGHGPAFLGMAIATTVGYNRNDCSAVYRACDIVPSLMIRELKMAQREYA